MDLNTVLSIRDVTCAKGVIHHGFCGRGMLRHIRSPSLRGPFLFSGSYNLPVDLINFAKI